MPLRSRNSLKPYILTAKPRCSILHTERAGKIPMTRLDPRTRVLILLFLLKTDKAGGSAANNIDNCVYWLTNRLLEGCAYLFCRDTLVSEFGGRGSAPLVASDGNSDIWFEKTNSLS